MNERSSYTIDVQVEPRFVPDQSRPGDNRYVFAYTITLHNAGDIAARLLTRHWIITDANGKVEEVTGEGVVGEQPWIRPGDEYEYTSGAVLETSVGVMQGRAVGGTTLVNWTSSFRTPEPTLEHWASKGAFRILDVGKDA